MEVQLLIVFIYPIISLVIILKPSKSNLLVGKRGIANDS